MYSSCSKLKLGVRKYVCGATILILTMILNESTRKRALNQTFLDSGPKGLRIHGLGRSLHIRTTWFLLDALFGQLDRREAPLFLKTMCNM